MNDPTATGLWAIQMIHHPSGIVGRGASVRLRPEVEANVRKGSISESDLLGTPESPGPTRRALANILPPICIAPECEVRFMFQDRNGQPYTFPPSKGDHLAIAESYFSRPAPDDAPDSTFGELPRKDDDRKPMIRRKITLRRKE